MILYDIGFKYSDTGCVISWNRAWGYQGVWGQ